VIFCNWINFQSDRTINKCSLSMFYVFVFPIASEWDNHEERRFVQDRAPPHFCASCSWLGLTNILLVGGLGVEDIRMAFATFPVLLHRVYFCKVVLKRKSTDESKKISEMEKQIPESFDVVAFDFLRKSAECVSSMWWKCVQSAKAYVEIRHWVLVDWLWSGAWILAIWRSF